MKLIFSVFHYFPHGGLQRDCLRIMRTALKHGHEIICYTTAWEAPPLTHPNFHLHLVNTKGWSNHRRMATFAKKTYTLLKRSSPDAVIGFNKMPHLDFYFAGDICLKSKLKRNRPAWTRYLPRYRRYLQLEKSVFSTQSHTHIFVLTKAQQKDYRAAYHTPADRFNLLPPGLPRNTLSTADMSHIRKHTRQALAIEDDQLLLLFVAAKFEQKGLDLAITALANLETHSTKLLVIGPDNALPYQKLAKQVGVASQVTFLGAKSPLIHELLAADILIHPARVEAAGMVLIEAIIMGLPILTTLQSGYAFHVQQAQSGMVVEVAELDNALKEMLNTKQRKVWSENALHYAQQTDLYNMGEQAIRIIEETISC